MVEILLIEDNIADAELTIRVLKKRNLANHLVHLRDGAQALDFIFGAGEFAKRNVSQLPKLILLDLKMPKVTGIEVLSRIRADKRTEKIPVVILTSSREDPDISECYRLKANSYIVKPVEFDDFLKAVNEVGAYWLLLNEPPAY
jgi:two-component system, response regulator